MLHILKRRFADILSKSSFFNATKTHERRSFLLKTALPSANLESKSLSRLCFGRGLFRQIWRMPFV